ncbi:hypothetical protein Nepgr_008803 [Nepenthes gracilis]|uniref:Uncharacterized protein n=1 Tax=Nepenthes gracilis TaxID=150966 RepID=A0AAD3S9B7_NEPGR|nr:hypothetical protein Nepgr_008803 [Nepenthes gracilis]
MSEQQQQQRPMAQKLYQSTPDARQVVKCLTATTIGSILLVLSGLNLDRNGDLPGSGHPRSGPVQPHFGAGGDSDLPGGVGFPVFRWLWCGSDLSSLVAVQLRVREATAGGGAAGQGAGEDCWCGEGYEGESKGVWARLCRLPAGCSDAETAVVFLFVYV